MKTTKEYKEDQYYRAIKTETIESIGRYVDHKVPPGSFLTAVLANDLMESIGRADSINRTTIGEICMFIHNEIPGNCHGSYGIVEKWLDGP